jgi:uncharacterized protein YqeY
VKTVDAWKTTLRARLREALGAREPHAVSVLRETLAAIENAEAPPVAVAPASGSGESGESGESTAFAGSVRGLGAREIPRLVLSPEAVDALIDREIRERREAADGYSKLGRHDEARTLTSQVDVLVALREPS